MRAFWRNVLYSGIRDQLEAEVQVKLLFVNTTIFIGVAVLAFFGIRDVASGQVILAWASFILVAAVLAVFFGIRVTRNYRLGTWFIPSLMFIYYSYLTWSGGSGATGSLWSLTFPLISVFMLGERVGGASAGVFLVVQAVFLYVPGVSVAHLMELEFKLRLTGVYLIIFAFSMAFEVIRSRAQNETETGRRQLLQAKTQTDGIFRNVREGIFLVEKDLTIDDQHSDSLGGLLGLAEPTGRPVLDAFSGLPAREQDAIRDYLEMFFAPSPPWELLQEINPIDEVSIPVEGAPSRRLEFSFHPVELESGRRVLGTVRDVTVAYELESKLKEEEDRSAGQMRHLFQIIHVKPELLLQFLGDATEEVASINRKLKDPLTPANTLVEAIFQGVHAVKGNAALVGLSDFSRKVHEIEGFIQAFRNTNPGWNDFLDMTVRLSQVQAELNEIQELMDRMAAFQKGLEASENETRDLLALTLRKAHEKLAAATGLDAQLDLSAFSGADLPDGHRKLVKDVLVQLIRNSYVHGIEPTNVRTAAGKSARGLVRVSTSRKNGRLVVTYMDDGKGLSASELRVAASQKEALATADIANWSDAKVLTLVFHPGFSTASQTTEHGGRGIGLGLVKSRIEAVGGALRMRTTAGKGLAFDIDLPLP